jgi:hypothetical protein
MSGVVSTTLWDRLRQHRGHIGGRYAGGGNHRASVFRRHVGAAIIRRERLSRELLDSWLDRHNPSVQMAAQEAPIEVKVSQYIGSMPFLWLSVPERPDRHSIERNSIALLSRGPADSTFPVLAGSATTPNGSRSAIRVCGTSTMWTSATTRASSGTWPGWYGIHGHKS